MLKNLNYICFDLETTWLNTQKDEPIQIGILQFDKDFNIINKYKTYIKPQKQTSELKDIVSYVTWIKLETLQNSPTIQEIAPIIQKFFTKDTVIIGQNITFDIDIIKRFIDLEFITSVDTLPLAKSIFHYLPSYSLEIINEHMISKNFQNSILDQEKNYHDALYDCFISYKIFRQFIERSKELSEKYPIISNLLEKSEWLYSTLLDINKSNRTFDKVFFPPLRKEIKNETNIYNPEWFDVSWYTNFTKFYIWNLNLKKVLSSVSWNRQNLVFCFSNTNKLQIAKKILNELWLKNIWYLKDESILSPEKITKLLSRKSYKDFEIEFVIKYFDQYEEWMGILDLNSSWDYKIFNFLKEKVDKKLNKIILTTHWGLFNAIKEGKDFSEFMILFFDWDLWYYSFSKYINQPVDIYNLINYVENLIYKKEIDWKQKIIENFYNWLLIFTGTLYNEITDKFIWVQLNKIEINPIIDNIDFHKTNWLLGHIQQHIDELKNDLDEEEFAELTFKIDEILETLWNIISVEKRMFNEDKFFYIFHKTNNVINYQEFLARLWENNTRFFTHVDINKSIKINKEFTTQYDKSIIEKIEDGKKVIQESTKYNNTFVLCTLKAKSKDLFENMFKQNILNSHKIYVENITWWLWKNIFYCKKENKKIVIWWYEFFINLISEWVVFDKIIIHHNVWPLSDAILWDIIYYDIMNRN